MKPFSAEDDGRLWEEAAEKARQEGSKFRETQENEKREQERLKSDQERIEKERRLGLFAGRSTLFYSDQLATEICERVSSGELWTVICRDEHMPTMRRCQQWLKEHSEFQLLFNMSLKDRLMVFEEQVLEIADDMRHDFKTVIKNGREKRVADPDMVARAKLRIEVRFRHLKAMKPERWGDVATLITKDADALDASNMSIEQLEQRLADIDAKDRISKAA
jgi:hypothetical protein